MCATIGVATHALPWQVPWVVETQGLVGASGTHGVPSSTGPRTQLPEPSQVPCTAMHSFVLGWEHVPPAFLG